jgi:DNA-binding transcriptional regulator YdaS (Cro superfamily)
MLLYTQDKYDKIRKAAWLEAVRFFGSEKELGIFLEVEQSAISKWINKPKRSIPYDKALAVEQKTRISIDRLSPNNPINKYLNERGSANKLILSEMLIDQILITDLPYLTFHKPDHHIIISTNGMLISGSVELQAYKATKINKIKVIILDLEGLLLGVNSIKDILSKFTTTELIAIGCSLEKLLENRQGQRNDLSLKQSKTQINSNNLGSLSTIWYEVTGRTDNKIAKILGLSKGSYLRAKQVYLNGSEELINALDDKQISIARAATIAKLPKDQQHNFIQLKKEKNYV